MSGGHYYLGYSASRPSNSFVKVLTVAALKSAAVTAKKVGEVVGLDVKIVELDDCVVDGGIRVVCDGHEFGYASSKDVNALDATQKAAWSQGRAGLIPFLDSNGVGEGRVKTQGKKCDAVFRALFSSLAQQSDNNFKFYCALEPDAKNLWTYEVAKNFDWYSDWPAIERVIAETGILGTAAKVATQLKGGMFGY